MLSILSSFLLSGTQIQPDSEDYSLVNETLIMLLEILNASKEIYVCLYVILPLAGLTQAYPQIVKKYTEQVTVLLKKIISCPLGGLDESSLLYVGHWIISFI